MSDVTPEFLAAVSEHTGVLVDFLTGDTIAAVCDSARRAVEWKQATAPPLSPQTATAAVSVPSDDRIVQMHGESPTDSMRAWRSGLLAGRGATIPPLRRTGEQHRNAGP